MASNLYTIPSQEYIEMAYPVVPSYMEPNTQPWVVVCEGYFNPKTCYDIVKQYQSLPQYNMHGCNAITRECPMPLDEVLDPVHAYAAEINRSFWNYELNHEPAAWLQTYYKDDSYQKHIDAGVAQMRKLTALVILSSDEDYHGGELIIHIRPNTYTIPKTQGTVVMYPFWVMHEVLPVLSGVRRTLNMGFFGPPFK